MINPFAQSGSDGQTVSVLQGARYLTAPTQAGELQFPEHAPIAAFDGNLSTSWVADRYLPVYDRWIEIGFDAPRNVPYVDLYPLSDVHGVVTEVDVNGIRHAVGSGWTRVVVNLHHVSAVRVTIDRVVQPKVGLGGPGGFKEIRIPGVHVRELLRPPVLTARALSGTDLRRDSLTYVFERTTGDDPFRRNPFGTSTVLDNPQDRGDAEQYIDRLVFAPAARSYAADAWAYPAVGAADPALDRLAGYRGPDRFDSSSRFQNQPAYRASSAFDGRADPGWVGVWLRPQAPAPWISWQTPRPLTVSRLRLASSPLVVRHPTVVQLSWSGGASPPLPVGPRGDVVLRSPVRASAFRLTVLDAQFPPGATARQRRADAVGIGAVVLPGLGPAEIPQAGPLRAPCGTVVVAAGNARVPMALGGTVGRLDAGLPLTAGSCRSVAIGAGVQEIRVLPGVFSVDLLLLHSAAPTAVPPPAGGGRVAAPGSIGQSAVSGVRVSLSGPSWLVLGESFDVGWRATCDGRSLGVPIPIDGYANGWAAPASCRNVSFSFAPQAGVRTSYAVSAVCCLLMVALLLFGARRGVTRRVPADAVRRLPEATAGGMALPVAVAAALVLAVPISLIFALRAGAVSFPLLAFVLWRGFGPATLTWAGAALLGIVVPITYLIVSPTNQGGYNFAYSTKLIAAHWFGVAAIVLLALAVWKTTAGARRERRGPPPSSPQATVDERDEQPVRAVEQEVVRT